MKWESHDAMPTLAVLTNYIIKTMQSQHVNKGGNNMARTIRTKVYQFNELTEQAKQKAIEWYRNDNNDASLYSDEIIASIKAVAELFDLKFGREYTDIRTSHINDNILQLQGVRLYKYLVNNYNNILFAAKKYYFCRRPDGSKIFNCVGQNSGCYVSKCQFEIASCPLTGVCYDMDILQPVYDFIKKPDTTTTFEDLTNEIESAISKTFNDTDEWVNSDTYITEQIKANEYEFTVEGKRFAV